MVGQDRVAVLQLGVVIEHRVRMRLHQRTEHLRRDVAGDVQPHGRLIAVLVVFRLLALPVHLRRPVGLRVPPLQALDLGAQYGDEVGRMDDERLGLQELGQPRPSPEVRGLVASADRILVRSPAVQEVLAAGVAKAQALAPRSVWTGRELVVDLLGRRHAKPHRVHALPVVGQAVVAAVGLLELPVDGEQGRDVVLPLQPLLGDSQTRPLLLRRHLLPIFRSLVGIVLDPLHRRGRIDGLVARRVQRPLLGLLLVEVLALGRCNEEITPPIRMHLVELEQIGRDLEQDHAPVRRRLEAPQVVLDLPAAGLVGQVDPGAVALRAQGLVPADPAGLFVGRMVVEGHGPVLVDREPQNLILSGLDGLDRELGIALEVDRDIQRPGGGVRQDPVRSLVCLGLLALLARGRAFGYRVLAAALAVGWGLSTAVLRGKARGGDFPLHHIRHHVLGEDPEGRLGFLILHRDDEQAVVRTRLERVDQRGFGKLLRHIDAAPGHEVVRRG